MHIDLKRCTLRPWRDGDQASLARHADNSRVAQHLRDLFPQPYTLVDADAWIAFAAGESPPLNLAIEVAGQPVGGIGVNVGRDIHRVSAEIGYWLGETFWGQGIASCALVGMSQYAFATAAELNRIFAYVDADHPASIRVLQKAGYRLEGTLIGGAIKHGQIRDQYLYAITRSKLV